MKEPRRLRNRPHWRGMPVPVTVVVDKDGTPDFATLDVVMATKCARDHLCALCGLGMKAPYVFVGGAASIEMKAFRDGAMHEDCARYAFFVCPHVSGEHRQYREQPKAHEGMTVRVSKAAVAKRMGMLFCMKYRAVYEQMGGRTVVSGYIINEADVQRVIWEDEIKRGKD